MIFSYFSFQNTVYNYLLLELQINAFCFQFPFPVAFDKSLVGVTFVFYMFLVTFPSYRLKLHVGVTILSFC